MINSLEYLSEYGYGKRLLFQPTVVAVGAGDGSTVPDAAKCTVAVSGGGTVAAGKNTITVTITAKNAADSAISVGGATCTLSYSGGQSTGVYSIITDVGNGTYTATFYGVQGGTATTIVATINSATITTTMPTITVTYATPDILNAFSFEDTYDVQASGPRINAFNSGAAVTPTGGAHGGDISFDATHTRIGSKALKRVLPLTPVVNGNSTDESEANVWCMHGRPTSTPWFSPDSPSNQSGAHGLDRIWIKIPFYIDAEITKAVSGAGGTLKFCINLEYGATGDQYGGIYFFNGAWGWCFAQEWGAAIHRIKSLSGLVGGFHTLEFEYWRKGDPTGYPSVAIWLDGVMITGSDYGNPPSPGSWITTGAITRLSAGQRVHDSALSNQLGSFNLAGVLNSGGHPNETSGNVWFDEVSASTLGRIGGA